MTLKLVNQTTKSEYLIENLSDLLKSRLFYAFDIVLPTGMLDGVYEYKLYEGTVGKATGLLQVGDFEPDNTTYKESKLKEQNGYMVYEG